ncbi:hypothetical protein L3X38_027368 [Prunus dulcis]|uniref:Cysteine proteinases superfamily protein n=1 Tax=Prunus dulcis TaxID=3755 RepID=A0AAD4VPN3_PRUDU|nr:hypothetical protein L3X38_027368 [Prunus dulcis]
MALTNQDQYLCLAFLFILPIFSSQASSRQIYDVKTIWRHMKTGWLNLGQFFFYKDAEEKERQFMIFKANLEFIKAFNKHMSQNYFTLSLNEFADLTNEEFPEIPNGYTKQSCKSIRWCVHCGINLDHGVTAVGYGTSSDGTKYWLVKNSWGTGWGEGGYVTMQRGISAKEGLSGIAMEASYPTA